MSPSGPGWFPQFGWMTDTQPDPPPQLNAVVHDELTGLSKQIKKLQAWSPMLPPTDDDMDQDT